MRTGIKIAVWLSIPVGAIGLAYEYGFFSELGASVFGHLGVKNFVGSGITIFAPIVMVISIYAMGLKFFSKRIEQDNLELVRKAIAEGNFRESLLLARLAAAFSLAFAVMVKDGAHFPFSSNANLSHIHDYMIFVILIGFLRCLLLAPKAAIPSILTIFLASMMLCAYAGGTGDARYAKGNPLRDDLVVKVTREGQSFQIQPKDFPFPALTWMRTIL
jgi:hypothetical protein